MQVSADAAAHDAAWGALGGAVRQLLAAPLRVLPGRLRGTLDESEAYDCVPQLLAAHSIHGAGMGGGSGWGDASVLRDTTRLFLRIVPSLTYVSPLARAARARVNPKRPLGLLAGAEAAEAAAVAAMWPPLPARPPPHQRKIRVGLVSGLFREHAVGAMALSLVEGLPKDRFQVALLQLPTRVDALSQRLARAATTALALPVNLTQARRRVESLQLDVLLLPDTLDPLAYFLAYSRLAPVQCAFWVRGTSLAMPWSVDYHVTSALFGAAHPTAAEHFSEQLVQLDGLAWIGGRRNPPPRPAGPPMHEFDGHHFYDDKHLYLSISSLRVHPDYDSMVARLLAADPAAELVIVDDDSEGVQQDIWREQLLQRFHRSLGRARAKRIRLFPQTNSSVILQLIRIADVVLDPFPLGNAIATHDAFSLATPVVTLPSRQRPGAQYAAGMYRAMGLAHHVPATVREYVARAVRLANDTAFRHAQMTEISRARAAIQRGSEGAAMDEWSRFLTTVTRPFQPSFEELDDAQRRRQQARQQH